MKSIISLFLILLMSACSLTSKEVTKAELPVDCNTLISSFFAAQGTDNVYGQFFDHFPNPLTFIDVKNKAVILYSPMEDNAPQVKKFIIERQGVFAGECVVGSGTIRFYKFTQKLHKNL